MILNGTIISICKYLHISVELLPVICYAESAGKRQGVIIKGDWSLSHHLWRRLDLLKSDRWKEVTFL